MDADNGIDAPSPIKEPQGTRTRDLEVISLLSDEGTPVPEIITLGSRPLRSTPTKRRPEDVAGQHKTKRYKETTRRDGAAIVDLDSDEDVEGNPAAQTAEQTAKNTRGLSKADSGTHAQDAGSASRLNGDQGAQRRSRKDNESASSRYMAAEEVDRTVHRGIDRHVRCETVEDEGTTDRTVIHQYQLHPQLLERSWR